MPEGTKSRTADRILDVAEALVQVRGYNAFSYADVARSVGLRKASLHHHFPAKADLGAAMLDRYRARFMAALDAIEAETDRTMERLERYVGLYGSVLRRGRLCLCGMLASDVTTLPKPMRERIVRFFGENEAWLARILAEGVRRGDVRFDGPAASMAAFFVSALEGAMLLARAGGRPGHFAAAAGLLLDRVRPAAAESPVLVKAARPKPARPSARRPTTRPAAPRRRP